MAQAPQKKADLDALRARIAALDAEMQATQASQREARDALRESERAISNANRTLAALEAEGRALREDARRLAARQRELEASLAAQQATLGRLLGARYASGAPEALRVVLSGDDPADLARRMHYLTYVSQALADLAGVLRTRLAELARLAAEAADKAARLRANEVAQRADRDRMVAERREKRRVMDRLGVEIRRQSKEIKTLRADEARLARLVQEIARVLAARPGAGYARVERVPDAAAAGRFSQLRGKIRLPVRGELTARFGAQTGTAGAVSKGVFIRAQEGQPVRAVAAGQVVYADWMRGFGNLLILDHGEAYLSIYGNNESLLKQVGDAVAPGEALATVGASGGREETGLYFELRHQGRAFDPLRWATLK